jgi:long-chain acyl-CoA synthetase
MDELDNVYWLARKTDVIRTKSGPIYPRVIEEVLFAHPSVRQACAVGINEDDGQTPVGFVTLFSRGEMPEELLLAHCRSNLDRAFWPSKIVVRDSLPMTPTGKIDKKRLKTE